MKRGRNPGDALVREWLAAAERGDLPALERMQTAEPRLVDALGQGPYWTGKARAIHFAAHRGHVAVTRWLLDRGASPNVVAGEFDWAPLHFAAMASKRTVYDLLVRRGAVPDIFTAAVLGQSSDVRRMLRQDPRLVARRGPDGATALHFAGSPAVARALLKAGARATTRDRFHKSTPVEWTLERPAVARIIAAAAGRVDVFGAAALGDLRTVRALVRRDRRRLSARLPGGKTIGGRGETALSIAARYGRREVVAFLLEAGAEVRVRPSPLPGAVQRQDRKIVKALLDAGADPNAMGPHGYAPLHAACLSGRLPMIRLLLARGARVDLRDDVHHATPLGWAEYFHHLQAAAYLDAAAAPRATAASR